LRQPPVLLVIDVQQGFRDQERWGLSANPNVYQNVDALVKLWRERCWPIAFVKHNSANPNSTLSQSHSGNNLEPFLDGPKDVLIQKSVNSAFYGTPDLHLWLTKRGFGSLVICGITTNYCCETTARMAGNLGYKVEFAIDATTAFPVTLGERVIPGEVVMEMTAANLNGEFAQVVETSELLEKYKTP
jgi:nicotinamidase-related amidase